MAEKQERSVGKEQGSPTTRKDKSYSQHQRKDAKEGKGGDYSLLIRPWKGQPNITVAQRDYPGLQVGEGHGFLQYVKEMGAKGRKQSLLNKS